MTINTATTVKDLAIRRPGATRVFESLGIDYCCGGAHSLEEACRAANVEIRNVVEELEKAIPDDEAFVCDWEKEPVSVLASFIVETHHAFTRQELDRIENLFVKVCHAHQQNHAELVTLQSMFKELEQDLITHMLKEEQILFPYVRRLEEAAGGKSELETPFFGTVSNPVRMMMNEHDTAGDILREMRELSNNYTAPADGCISYQTLYQAMRLLEEDLHQHIHLENNILFPRAIEIEEGLRPEWRKIAGKCCGH